jgi:hypothetical protein
LRPPLVIFLAATIARRPYLVLAAESSGWNAALPVGRRCGELTSRRSLDRLTSL